MASLSRWLQMLQCGTECLFVPIIGRSMHCSCPKMEAKSLVSGAYRFGMFSKIYRFSSLTKSKSLAPLQYRRFFATKPTKPDEKNGTGRPDLRQGATVQYHELPIMFVHANYNNTLFTITDHNGKIAARTTAGMEGFKGAKRGTNYAGQMAATAAAKKARSLGIETLRVKIKGMGPGRNSSIKGLMAGGIDIVSITDVTPVPHNGCKPPKQRRI